MRHRVSLFLAALLLAGCAVVTPRPAPPAPPDTAVGTTVSGAFDIGGKRVPLPKGEWTVIGSQVTPNNKRAYNARVMLAHIDDGVLVAAVEINTNIVMGIPPVAGGWSTHRNCARTDLHFVEVISNTARGDQECWWVNHWRMSRTGNQATEHWEESRKYIAERGIEAPIDMVAASFRFADDTRFLTVNYFFNPATSGFETRKNTEWRPADWRNSEWHPDRVRGVPGKEAYIDKIIAWGAGFREAVRGAFMDKRAK